MPNEEGLYSRLPDGAWAMNTQLTGSNMELYGKSTDAKPTTNIKVGTTFFEIDTKTVYMWDGSTWAVI